MTLALDRATTIRAAVDAILDRRPDIVAAGAEANQCGPVAYALADELRQLGYDAGAAHVYGAPVLTEGSPLLGRTDFDAGDAAHYVVMLDGYLIDAAFRQFDPAADRVTVYSAEDVTDGECPWYSFEAWLDAAAPLDVSFFAYPGARWL